MLVTNTNQSDRDDLLSDIQAKLLCPWASSDVVLAWMEKESRRITKDTIVDVGILYDGACIMPLAVEDETDSQECGCDQQCPEGRKVLLPVAEVPTPKAHRCISLAVQVEDHFQFPSPRALLASSHAFSCRLLYSDSTCSFSYNA